MSKKKTDKGVFNAFNYAIMLATCVIFLYPFIYTVALSFSSPAAVMQGAVWLYPVQFTTAAYEALFKDRTMITSFLYTVQLAVFGVIGSITATTLTAYPLSKRELKGKNIMLNMIIFTMYFSGGLIPTYLVVRGIGLLDRMGALIIPNLISTFLLFIMINYFRGLPAELEESAKLDGASNFKILINIIIPLSIPIIATLTIYYAVSYWNTFFNALMYITSTERYPLQIKLYMILNNTDIMTNSSDVFASQVLPENLKGAVVVVTALPILTVYPFLQKYFIKGVTIGALKG